MARVDHTLQTLNPQYSLSGKNLTLTVADTTNDEAVVIADRILVIAHNNGASPATVTVNSVAINNRTGDITAHSVAADGITVFGPFSALGYAQSDGKLYFEASSTDIRFACVKVP